ERRHDPRARGARRQGIGRRSGDRCDRQAPAARPHLRIEAPTWPPSPELDDAGQAGPSSTARGMHDLLIRGAAVVDGTGTPARQVDVAVAGGKIVALGDGLGDARRVFDATGSVLAPGFIDIHTHSDYAFPVNPRAESKIRQGVTTEVVGNCGYSVAPAPAERVGALREYLAASGPFYPFRETTFAGYVEEFPRTSVNVVLQVGHNTLRLVTVGMEPRAPRADEMRHMVRLLEEALAAGAIGLSSGLFTA